MQTTDSTFSVLMANNPEYTQPEETEFSGQVRRNADTFEEAKDIASGLARIHEESVIVIDNDSEQCWITNSKTLPEFITLNRLNDELRAPLVVLQQINS